MNRRSAIALVSGGALIGASALTRAVSQPRPDADPNPDPFPNGSRWLYEFAKGKGEQDDTSTFQRAIDYVRSLALRARDTSHLPALLIPSGRYVLKGTIETAPWIKVCSVGGVLLDFTQLPVGWDGITCRNETTLVPTDLRYPGDRSPFLDGGGGTISILGPGKERAEGWGIVMGNRDAGFPGAVRDAGGCNVVVSGWRGALRIDPINTYLTAWSSSRFEQNREEGIYVASPGARSVNSGERMTFVDCTFAGSSRALHIDSDSMDFVFDGCSFDFNGDVIHFGHRARFGTVALSHCHIEGIDGLLVNATDTGDHLRTVLRDSIILPRHWKRKDLTNAPRQLVAGSAKFSASGVEWRFESPPHDPMTALIGDDVPVEFLSGMSFQGVPALPWKGQVINADSDFALDPIGTTMESLSQWSVSVAAPESVSGHIEVVEAQTSGNGTPNRRRALCVRAQATRDILLSIGTRAPFLVQAGETITAACSAKATGDLGRIDISVQFRGATGIPLQGVNVGSVLSDGHPIVQTVAPAGAADAVLKVTFTNWSGQLQITEMAAWRTS